MYSDNISISSRCHPSNLNLVKNWSCNINGGVTFMYDI